MHVFRVFLFFRVISLANSYIAYLKAIICALTPCEKNSVAFPRLNAYVIGEFARDCYLRAITSSGRGLPREVSAEALRGSGAGGAFPSSRFYSA